MIYSMIHKYRSTSLFWLKADCSSHMSQNVSSTRIMYNRLVQHAITNQYKAPRQDRLHLNHIYIDICRCGWLKAGSCSFSYFCLRAEGAAAPDG